MTFGELRNVLSKNDHLSICDRETLKYRNFLRVTDVPKRYDSLHVCGVGMTQSEFYQINEHAYSPEKGKGHVALVSCLEIVTTKRSDRLWS